MSTPTLVRTIRSSSTKWRPGAVNRACSGATDMLPPLSSVLGPELPVLRPGTHCQGGAVHQWGARNKRRAVSGPCQEAGHRRAASAGAERTKREVVVLNGGPT